MEMQIQYLENIGYSFEHDRLDKAGLEDHSYYFRFIFQEKTVIGNEIENKV